MISLHFKRITQWKAVLIEQKDKGLERLQKAKAIIYN